MTELYLDIYLNRKRYRSSSAINLEYQPSRQLVIPRVSEVCLRYRF